MPQGPIATINQSKTTPTQAANLFKNAAAAGNTQVKTGAGVFCGLTVNTGGTNGVVTFYDGTSSSGAKIGAFVATAAGVVTPPNGPVAFTTGLFMVVAGSPSPDVTAYYQ